MIGEVPHAARDAELPRNDELAAQFELLADLMELEGARRVPDRRVPPRGRRGSSRPAAPVAQLALDGRAKELQGIGKTIEEKIVEVGRGRRDPRADEAQGRGAGRGRVVHAPARGSGRRRRGGSGRSSGSRPSTSCAPPPRRTGSATSAGSAPSRRRRSSPRSRSRARPRARSARCSGTTLPQAPRASRRRSPPTRRRVQVSIAGSARRFRETVRDLDLIATATDAPALLDAFCDAPWVVEVAAQRRHEGDRRRPGRPALRPPRRPARVVRQPAPALHRLEGPQRRAARGGGAAAGSRSRSTGSPRSRAARCTRSRPRRRSTRSSATSGSRRSCARTAASSRRRAPATLPEARRARRPPRRPAHAHDLVGRQGHARGDGRRGGREAATSTTRSATTRTASATACSTQQAEAIDALERSACRCSSSRGSR